MSSDRRLRFCIPVALFSLVLVVYASTLCPTVYWEDAGELITVSHVLGIAHPPGHPLYAILGHLFTLVPFGTIAARVNLMSAFFGAVAAALVYPAVLALRRKDGNPLVAHCSAVTAALCAAFGLSLWDQSVVAETSTLHAFFFMSLVLVFLTVIRAPKDRSFTHRLWLFSLLFGLSLTNHVAGVFVTPAFALWAVIKAGRRLLKWENMVGSVVFFAFGLSVYLYLPIRSAQDPLIDWGNPESLANFWWVVSAAQFRDNVLDAPATVEMLEAAIRRLSDICENYLAIGVALIVLGAWDSFRRRKDFLLFAAVVIGTLFAVTLNPSFILAYFIPALLLLAMFLGFGANMAAHAILNMFRTPASKRVAVICSCAVLLLLPAIPLARHYPMNDKSRYHHARDYGVTILEALPPNAAFFTIDLNAVFTLWYLIYCEGMRPDVIVVEPTWLTNSDQMREELLARYPDLLMPEIGERAVPGELLGDSPMYDRDLLFSILRKNAEIRPVYWGATPVVPSLRPRGLVYELVAVTEDPMAEDALRENAAFWEDMTKRFRNGQGGLSADRVASQIYPENLRHQGQYFKNMGRTDLARWAFELSSTMNPSYAPAFLDLGELYKEEGDFETAFRHLQNAANLDYRVKDRASYHKGQIFYEIGEYDRAMAEFVKVVRRRPNYPNVHNMIGSICLVRGDPVKAEAEFQEEIKRNPSTPAAYSNLAQIMIQKGNLEEAERLLEAGIDADASMWQNLYFLAQVNVLKGRPDAAQLHLRSALARGGERVRQMSQNERLFDDILPEAMEGVGE
jgi:tetratricopeptide (TPR) repeat protein